MEVAASLGLGSTKRPSRWKLTEMSGHGALPAKQDQAALELSLVIEGPSGSQQITLVGNGASISIGRAPDSQVQLASSGQDVVLRVRDTSRNGTGARHSRYSQAQRPFKELKEGEEEVLHHRSQLLIPLKEKDKGRDTRSVLTIYFNLPDAYNPAQESTPIPAEKEKLGEGGLAVVYRARDVSGSLGEVAVKVSKFKNLPVVSNQNRHVYALHREAQWSMKCLHNTEDPRYDQKGAELFAKYLEDHTGFDAHDDVSFDATRRKFEDPDFAWSKHSFEPKLAREPYVVMELVEAKLLQSVIDANPPLDFVEKRTITRQCVDSLLYLSKFEALHRDFRGCNIFLQGRGKGCQLKVIDLGFMISADAHQEKNPNIAVRCAWQGNKDKDTRIRFDWAPPEVRTKEVRNFGLPGSSFDIFSLGAAGPLFWEDVVNSRDMSEKLLSITADIKELRLPPQLFRRMLDKNSENRPTPKDLSAAFSERPKRRKGERPPLVQVQDKNLLIPVTPPSDGGFGMGYTRAVFYQDHPELQTPPELPAPPGQSARPPGTAARPAHPSAPPPAPARASPPPPPPPPPPPAPAPAPAPAPDPLSKEVPLALAFPGGSLLEEILHGPGDAPLGRQMSMQVPAASAQMQNCTEQRQAELGKKRPVTPPTPPGRRKSPRQDRQAPRGDRRRIWTNDCNLVSLGQINFVHQLHST
eukprot:s2700_g7.t1